VAAHFWLLLWLRAALSFGCVAADIPTGLCHAVLPHPAVQLRRTILVFLQGARKMALLPGADETQLNQLLFAET